MNQRYNESTWAILAGMRFALAGIVLIRHLHVFAPLPYALRGFSELGAVAAVLGFLLISGLSIGYSYAQNANGYLQRRFLRIYPLYFFAVFGTIVLTALIGFPYELPGQTLVGAGWKTSIANLFFLQNFCSITIPYNGPLWTLGVEVSFYLMAPLLFKVRTEALAVIVVMSMVLFIFYPQNWLFGYQALRYIWPWLIGFILSTQRRISLVVALLALGVLVTALNKSDVPESLSWLTFGLVAGAVVLLSVYQVSVSKTIQKILNFFGELSYPLYLFHFPLYLLLYRYFAVRNAWTFLLFMSLGTVVLNYVLDHWLKRVFWKPLVSRLFPKRSVAMPASAL